MRRVCATKSLVIPIGKRESWAVSLGSNIGLSNRPLVSILVCVKNGMPYLPEALRSLVNQTYTHFEVIVQDGGSTDGTLEFLSARDSALQTLNLQIRSEADDGVGHAYHLALGRAQGSIVGTLDADNLLEPGGIHHAVEAFQAQPELAAVYGWNRLINASGEIVQLFQPGPFNLISLLTGFLVPPFSTAFFNRPVCGEALAFDPDYQTCVDFSLWLQLGNLPIEELPSVLATTRLSDKSMSCHPSTYDRYVEHKRLALKRFFNQPKHQHYPKDLYPYAESGILLWAARAVFGLTGGFGEQFERYWEEAFSLTPRWAEDVRSLCLSQKRQTLNRSSSISQNSSAGLLIQSETARDSNRI